MVRMVLPLRRAWVVGVLLACANAYAVVPTSGPRVPADALTAMPSADLAKPLRAERKLLFRAATLADHRQWQASWDAATGVPMQLWGEGIAAPGSIANAATAEQVARRVLADNLQLLAPGAALSDFVLVSNHFDGEIRSIGFAQHKDGLRVVGGQISFRFKADRLYVIGSAALPNVVVKAPMRRSPNLRDHRAKRLREVLAMPNAPITDRDDHDVILPLVADDTVLGYRVARPLTIDGGAEGRYLAYADAATGEVLAVRQLNTYATGKVLYRVTNRWPQNGRIDAPANRAHVVVNGTPQTTDATGVVSWGDGEVTIGTSIEGDFVSVVNKATGAAVATALLALQPNGSLAWDASATEQEDAQVNAYVSTTTVKDWVRANLDPALPTIDEVMTVNVNIAQNCNAFFDGKAINFFQSSANCQNTALLQDVVYHEYGHRVHTAEIIDGVGDFDGAMSEGAADFVAASITGDHGMGRGFFYTNEPLRDLDPMDKEFSWPGDIGEIHHTGQIFAGVFWDLRKALIADLGETAGITLTNKLFVAALRRSVNIPTSLIEVLAADDDDGNLDNGTPHECTIRAAYGRHGIRTASGRVIAPDTLTVPALATGIQIEVTGTTPRCTGDEVVGATVDWVPSYTGVPAPGSVEASPAGANKFFAQLPLADHEVVYYRAKVKFADGSTLTLADNIADPYYQLYQGKTVPLYCTDFESEDPFAAGWTTGTDADTESPFQWGTPTGGATDPHAAYSGSKILAQKLDGDYNAKERAWLKSPVIDVGQYSDVRLQYRRWLAAEDSHFDQAMITANDKQVWLNYTANMGDSSSIHHVDREWRFHDVALSSHFTGHKVQVGWEITSDEGLELGGWQLDDVCIVANPNAICGDGVKTPTEQCDSGADNKDAPNVCHTDCRLPTCGDNYLDTGEQCDEGGATDTCSSKCESIEPIDSGCCSTSGGAGSLALSGLVGMFLFRRRRK
jgi:hypothetical protein